MFVTTVKKQQRFVPCLIWDPRLRAADPRDDFGDGRISREALRSISHSSAANRSAAIRKELREIENAHARS